MPRETYLGLPDLFDWQLPQIRAPLGTLSSAIPNCCTFAFSSGRVLVLSCLQTKHGWGCWFLSETSQYRRFINNSTKAKPSNAIEKHFIINFNLPMLSPPAASLCLRLIPLLNYKFKNSLEAFRGKVPSRKVIPDGQTSNKRISRNSHNANCALESQSVFHFDN